MIQSFVIAFATYSKIPMPRVEWSKKSMKYSLCFFPCVGAVIGLCSVGADWLLRAVGAGTLCRAVFLTVLPLLLTGGIHMDGFLDTIDAKSSYQPAEEKLKILKDPHTGAFAIIYGMVYLLLCLGLFSEINQTAILFVALGYVYSRAWSGLSVVTFRRAKKDGMAADSAEASPKKVKWILGLEILCCMAGYLWMNPLYGGLCVLAGIAVFLYYRYMSYAVFGGITGDLAGYFLQLCELAVAAVCAAGSWFVG
jgi:adenosylcobinamide-GDP ribazoletransferase